MANSDVIRVLVVDDHVLFREGLAGLLKAQPDFEVVGEAGDGAAALVKARELAPDLVLMDIAMPVMGGLEATRQITWELPATCVMMLTASEQDGDLFGAIQAGARGFMLKSTGSQELLQGLRRSMAGGAVITPALALRMLEEFRRLARLARPEDQACDVPALTAREREVLVLAARGATDKEIADELTVSLHTVKSHMRNILARLHLSSRYEAARYLREHRV